MDVQANQARASSALGRKLGLTAWVYISSILVNVGVSSGCLLLYFRPAFQASATVFDEQGMLGAIRGRIRHLESHAQSEADDTEPTDVQAILHALRSLPVDPPPHGASGEWKESRAICAALVAQATSLDELPADRFAATEEQLSRAIALLDRERYSSLDRASRAQQWVTGLLVVNSLIGAGLCAAGLWFVRRRVVHPTAMLQAAAAQIREGCFEPAIALPHDDEMGALGREMGQMARHIASLQQQLIARERMTTAGQMVEHVEKNVHRPLAQVQQLAEATAKRQDSASEVAQCQERISLTIRQFEAWLGGLKARLTCPAGPLQPISVADLFASVLAAVRSALDRHRVQVHAEFDDAPREVRGDAFALEQALVSLVTNAVQASSEGQTIRLAARPCPGRDGWWQMVVADQGSGIDRELLEKIFLPFFTTKREGTGIGLGLVLSAAHQHGGELTVDSKPGQGATFTITLPENPLPPTPVEQSRGEVPPA